MKIFLAIFSFVIPVAAFGAAEMCFEFDVHGYSDGIETVRVILPTPKKVEKKFTAHVTGIGEKFEVNGQVTCWKRSASFEAYCSRPLSLHQFSLSYEKEGGPARFKTSLFDFADDGDSREDLALIPAGKEDEILIDGDVIPCTKARNQLTKKSENVDGEEEEEVEDAPAPAPAPAAKPHAPAQEAPASAKKPAPQMIDITPKDP